MAAKWTVQSEPGKGTAITCTFPNTKYAALLHNFLK